jgi:hypothetical protein
MRERASHCPLPPVPVCCLFLNCLTALARVPITMHFGSGASAAVGRCGVPSGSSALLSIGAEEDEDAGAGLCDAPTAVRVRRRWRSSNAAAAAAAATVTVAPAASHAHRGPGRREEDDTEEDGAARDMVTNLDPN